MSFENILDEICRTAPGTLSAVVMNLDGLVVARRDERGDGLDVEAVLVELLSALKSARQAAGQVEGGALREFTLDLGQVIVVLRPLGDEHFAALALAPQAVTARGRYALRLKAMELSKELA